jgi:microcystin-dependent protein
VNSSFSPNVETFVGKNSPYFVLSGGGGGGDTNLTVTNLTVTNSASIVGDSVIGGFQVGGNTISNNALGANIALSVGTISADRVLEFGAPNLYSMPPVGTILMYAGTGATLFEKYEFCQGQVRQKALFPELYAVIGNTWGPSTDTSFTFPDLQGRVPVGVGTVLGGGTYALGGKGGAESHTIGLNEMPSHTHGFTSYTFDNGFVASNPLKGNSSPATGVASLTSAPTGQGTQTAVSLLQPYNTVNYIIRARS